MGAGPPGSGMTMMPADLAGPPGISAMDSRLDFLNHNREQPRVSDADRVDPRVRDIITPLIVAQLMDLLTTEKPVGFLAHSDSSPGGWVATEGNPLPGMQSTVGRLGWGGAEAALGALLAKKYPKLGRAYATIGNVAHNAMVDRNRTVISDIDRLNRVPGPRNR